MRFPVPIPLSLNTRRARRSPDRAITASMRAISTISVPKPNIAISHALPASTLHFCHRIFQSGHHCTTNNGMTDIQFMHLRDGGNSFHVVIGRPVTSVNFQTETGKGRGFGDTRQLLRLFGVSFGISIATGVDLDKRCANLCRSFDLLFIGVDKENLDPGICQTFCTSRFCSRCPATSRARPLRLLLPDAFSQYRQKCRASSQRRSPASFGHRHLQIHAGIQRLTQDAHMVSNVAAIFHVNAR